MDKTSARAVVVNGRSTSVSMNDAEFAKFKALAVTRRQSLNKIASNVRQLYPRRGLSAELRRVVELA